MTAFLAFLKKESLEHLRSGRATVLGILFVLFGIMNPAVAKLTPWLMEMFADSLAESGMIITGITVSAMESWVQFFKNIPMALTAFILLESSIFTREYQSGTLVLSLTKGLARHKVVLCKTLVLTALWTMGYWLCFAITYGYNAYFWDNTVAQNLLFSAFSWWIFGLWTVALTVFFSTVFHSGTGVLMGTGSVVLFSWLVGLLPKVGKYLPTTLTDGNSLIYGLRGTADHIPAIAIASVMCLGCVASALAIFNRKQL